MRNIAGMRTLALSCMFWLLAAPAAWAQTAVLSHVEGSVAVSAQGDEEWLEVRGRHMLRQRDRLWTDPKSRVEVQVGAHLLRLDAQSHLSIDKLAQGVTQVSLRRGSMHARVGPVAGAENVEIDTPNVAVRATSAGSLRVDVDAQRSVTQVSVAQGSARVFGQSGQSRELHAGQAATFAGRALAQAAPVRAAAADGFDRWLQQRERVAGGPKAPPATAAMGAPRALPAVPTTVQDQQRAERARQARLEAQRRRARHEAWVRQQKEMSDRWQREHEEWLRFQEGGPPPASQRGIPARRIS
jgi:hypothetical protein